MVGKPVCGLGADVGDFWGMDSRESAKEKARCWLGWLANNGRIDWSSFGPDGLRAAPSPDLYCDVGGGTVETDNGEHEPFFLWGAASKRNTRRWQAATIDNWTGVPLPPREGLEETERIMQILVSLAEVPYPPWRSEKPTEDLFQRGFDEDTLPGVLDDAIGVLADHIRPVDGLRDALRHLMDNAVRHSGERRGVFTLGRVGDRMVARVEDQGVGMCSTSEGDPDERSVADVFKPGLTPLSGLQKVVAFTAKAPGLVMSLASGTDGYIARDGQGHGLLYRGCSPNGTMAELLIPVTPAREAG